MYKYISGFLVPHCAITYHLNLQISSYVSMRFAITKNCTLELTAHLSFTIIIKQTKQFVEFWYSRILKLSQWLGAAPQTPAFVNSILVLEPPSKNPGYAPACRLFIFMQADIWSAIQFYNTYCLKKLHCFVYVNDCRIIKSS